jgi:hypothetical protein
VDAHDTIGREDVAFHRRGDVAPVLAPSRVDAVALETLQVINAVPPSEARPASRAPLDDLRERVLPAHGCGGPLSWHCRKMTSRSIRIPPGPSIQISAGCCLKTVHAKSIAAAGTAKVAGD